MNNTDDLPYDEQSWVALIEPFSSNYIIPNRVGTERTVPFGAVGKVVSVRLPGLEPGNFLKYNIAFHAGWMALDVPHNICRPARMLEQLALCADGC